ncbi:GM16844 [Drosophila sechellia]|uniref:GM16844 n=1 Tax=Drosophila sechellia TaxID=7238 RepID=B4IDE5_DROSE|nr:GM16844 [Drosophila sechellia]
MPFPLSNPDACVDSGLKCPLEKGESYRYTATLQVLKSYPRCRCWSSGSCRTRTERTSSASRFPLNSVGTL